MAARIRDALADLDPSGAEHYARGYEAFVAKLDALDREIRRLLTGLSGRRFMVFHPAWGYFADTYGLVQVPVERGGKEPGARTLAALIEQARRDDVRVIFVKPQFGERSAARLAEAIGGRVVSVDPLAADYLDNLRYAARQIAAALKP